MTFEHLVKLVLGLIDQAGATEPVIVAWVVITGTSKIKCSDTIQVDDLKSKNNV